MKRDNHGGGQLVLFIAGRTLNSQKAVENLRVLSDRTRGFSPQTEVVDILDQPERAHREGVLVVPTLVRKGNGDDRRVVGDLSDISAVIGKLGLL